MLKNNYDLDSVPELEALDSGSMDLRFEAGKKGVYPLDPKELQFLQDLASWKHGVPPLDNRARRATLLRKETLLAKDWRALQGVQIKGIGFREGKRAMHPSTRTPYRPPYAPTVTPIAKPDGSLGLRLPKVEPLGGWTVAAQREFEALVRLHESGIEAPLPIDYGRIEGKQWQGRDLEVGIWGLTSRERIRVGDHIQNWPSHDYDWKTSPVQKRDCVEFTIVLNRRIAQILRETHEKADLVGLQPHYGNFTYDPETNRVIAHDFENAVRASSLEPNQVAYQAVADTAILFRKQMALLTLLSQLGFNDPAAQRECVTETLNALYEGKEDIKNKLTERLLQLTTRLQTNDMGDVMNDSLHVLLPTLLELQKDSEFGNRYPTTLTPAQLSANYRAFERKSTLFVDEVVRDPRPYQALFDTTYRPSMLQEIVDRIEAYNK